LVASIEFVVRSEDRRHGSPSVRIASAAMCPVVVARGRRGGEPPPTAGPVVVGVDGAAGSEAA
jgi:hypothetical protein